MDQNPEVQIVARFYASIQGNRGEATRMGTANSGIEGHVRGWNIGAKVEVDVDPKTGKDRLTVYRTQGSNGCGMSTIYTETLKD